MRPSAHALQAIAERLTPHRQALTDRCLEAVSMLAEPPEPDVRGFCKRAVDSLLDRLSRGELDALLAEEAAGAQAALAAGASLEPRFRAARMLERSCLALIVDGATDPVQRLECVLALHELTERRLEVLLQAQQDLLERRLHDAEEHAVRMAERAREMTAANEALRRAQAQSQHRAEQIEMLSAVVHRIAGVLDPERLMQEAAEVIQARLNHPYVAVVVVDDEGVLVGRWAGRPGVGRRSTGRAQGPAGGVIGRALRKRAPQVVSDVTLDPDYWPDVPGTRSEMVVPLLEGGEAIGAIDFQSEAAGAFGLDAVAVGETLAEFLVQGMRNARLFAESRGREEAR
ncbi:MAG TPA: GAF domain-containing protein [Vicinamibacteria bacterium]|nr:GAF domain-containing protein [Vicinamibacteria bacterium]